MENIWKQEVSFCHSNSQEKASDGTDVKNYNNNNPIYQPLRSGRIWHKVNF